MIDLHITVSHLYEHGRTIERSISLEEVDEMFRDCEGLRPRSELAIAFKVRPKNGEVYATGHLKGLFQGVCGRCLAPVAFDLDTDLSAVFKPRKKALTPTDGEVELEEADLDVCFYSDDTINMAEFIREAIILEQPPRLLCDENCAGLCSKCGVNLNDGSCECDHTDIDPRLMPLLALKKKLENN